MAQLPFVYLTSPPFSGSTLISFLINTHPKIATVGEMTGLVKASDPNTYKCSCGNKIRDCDFWKKVTEQMAARNFKFDPAAFDTRITFGANQVTQRVLNSTMKSAFLEDARDWALKLSPTYHRRLSYLIDRNKALARSILSITRKTVFFDASKNPAIIRHLNRDAEIDLRVVHLVRDVRGTSLSRRKNKGETNWRQSVDLWIRSNENIERQLKRLSRDQWIRIRYEDVCNSTAHTLNRFYDFCGLKHDSSFLDFQSMEHHIVGNRMRLTNASQIRLDETWRRSLNAVDHAYARKAAGFMHVRYGYGEMTDSDLNYQVLA